METEEPSPESKRQAGPTRVFIAHAKEDREFAAETHSFLEDKGFDAWIDERDIKAAALWNEQIRRAIQETDILLVVVSAASVRSHFVSAEVQSAFEQNKKILPVVIDDEADKDRIDLRLRTVQHVKLSADGGLAWTSLEEAVREVASGAPPKPDSKRDPFRRKKWLVKLTLGAILLAIVIATISIMVYSKDGILGIDSVKIVPGEGFRSARAERLRVVQVSSEGERVLHLKLALSTNQIAAVVIDMFRVETVSYSPTSAKQYSEDYGIVALQLTFESKPTNTEITRLCELYRLTVRNQLDEIVTFQPNQSFFESDLAVLREEAGVASAKALSHGTGYSEVRYHSLQAPRPITPNSPPLELDAALAITAASPIGATLELKFAEAGEYLLRVHAVHARGEVQCDQLEVVIYK